MTNSNNQDDAQDLWRFLDKLVPDSQNQSWFKSFVERNAVSIQALIENDTFGSLSEFDEKNPAPEPLEQVQILKAYLEGKPKYKNYNVSKIAGSLACFVDTGDLVRTLDNNLLTAQLHREANWNIKLNEPEKYLGVLSKVQIMDEMARKLNTLPDSEDKRVLTEWIKDKRKAHLVTVIPATSALQQASYYVLGASQLSQFVRNEWNNIRSIYFNLINSILLISRAPSSIRTLGEVLLKAANTIVRVGSIFLLPLRLALTLFRDVFHVLVTWPLRRVFWYLARRGNLPEMQRALRFISFGMLYFLMSTALYFAAAYYFCTTLSISFGMFIGLQFFPTDWTWPFIGALVLGTAVAEYVLGSTLLVATKIRTWWRGAPLVTERIGTDVTPIAPVASVAPIPVPVVEEKYCLNEVQRDCLSPLLRRRLQEVQRNSEISPEKKRKKTTELLKEIREIGNKETPYFLSRMDKKLLQKQTPPQEAFQEVDLSVKPSAKKAG